jgi:hypothetical protein
VEIGHSMYLLLSSSNSCVNLIVALLGILRPDVMDDEYEGIKPAVLSPQPLRNIKSQQLQDSPEISRTALVQKLLYSWVHLLFYI